MPNYTTEIAIVGGGICGLWLLNLLRDHGYDANLFEKDQLGSVQTLASQGMIHGGVKYTLGGFTTPASESIANMPATWRACIDGSGPLDLSGLSVLSDDYYLFSDGALSSRITAFFASKSLRGRINQVAKSDYPEVFNHPEFKGHLYKLQDIVIDTGELIDLLRARQANHIFRGHAVLEEGEQNSLLIDAGTRIQAEIIILAAGEGNGRLTEDRDVSMQVRPLKQVLVRGDLPTMYAHAVSLKDAAKPRLTITTHPMPDGSKVWYLGGNLAENGVDMTDEELIDKTKSEISDLLPWVDMSKVSYATLPINRAEPSQDSGARPDNPYVKQTGQVITCWPTKLTLTPLLGQEVLDLLPPPSGEKFDSLQLPLASRAPFPWELSFA
jgi:glycerol-3-phosphate dehydrogenase